MENNHAVNELMMQKKEYVTPSVRTVPVRLEGALLTASTEPIPNNPLDPGFEE